MVEKEVEEELPELEELTEPEEIEADKVSSKEDKLKDEEAKEE